VEKSPGIDKHKPVSRQMESLLADYYGFPYYWERPDFTAEQLAAANRVAAMQKSFEATGCGTGAAALPYEAPDVHLWSLREITNYNIAATDGEVGAVIDFILHINGDWKIRYMALDTGNWLPGRKVLISPQSFGRIDWAHQKLNLDLTRVQIKDSPEYNKVKEITRDYETRLDKHYGYKTAGQI
jgi:hypothetical protein